MPMILEEDPISDEIHDKELPDIAMDVVQTLSTSVAENTTLE